MYLLRQLLIADLDSPYRGQTVDVLLHQGRIDRIDKQVDAPRDCPVYDGAGRWLSPGFLDIGAYLGDPGHEEREDIQSLIEAGRRGGYTQLAVLPNTDPARHDKSGIEYLRHRGRGQAVDLLPLGAVSRNTAGQEITEMIDMQRAGAVGFTDGLHPIQSPGMLKLALQYVKTFGGTIINQPIDSSLAPKGQLHEGEMSTRLGMPGLPVQTETLALYRDIELLAYTDSRLLVHLLSSAKGVELLHEAKMRDLDIYASVSVAHLQYTVDRLADFDPDYKLLPPLREEADRQALVQAVTGGLIDHIASHHQSHQPEAKKLEFPYAEFGSQFLPTCVAQAHTELSEQLSPDKFCALFSHGPRRALGMEPLHIAEGMPASLTIFDPELSWTPRAEDFGVKSTNSPAIGQALTGRPVATYHNDQLWTSV